jgi:multiple sugar transport system permease protein
MMAATCFITLPVIAAFLVGQRQFIEGITMTGMKG